MNDDDKKKIIEDHVREEKERVLQGLKNGAEPEQISFFTQVVKELAEKKTKDINECRDRITSKQRLIEGSNSYIAKWNIELTVMENELKQMETLLDSIATIKED
jgi:hypothetical protein